MAVTVSSRRVVRLYPLSRFKRGPIWFRGLQGQANVNAEDLDDSDGALLPDESPKHAYRLYYNPSLYCHIKNPGTALIFRESGDNDRDDELCSSALTLRWQQSNTYNIISSRRLSSTKNTLLDLAFTKSPETESQLCRSPIPPDVRVDTRAFLKCRPEYLCMSLNVNQRPPPTPFEKSAVLLQKATVLKRLMAPSDVSSIMWELSCVDQDKTALVRGDQRFTMLIRYSVENLQLYTLAELLEVLQAFVWLDMPPAHSVLALYESELCQRVDQMTLHQLLFAADLWRCIGKQVPQFLKQVYRFVPLYMSQMKIPELVQLMYIMGEGRYCPSQLVQPVEKLLMHHLHELQSEEVGTVCLGLFKSQTSLSEGTVMCLVDKASSAAENMSDFALVNVMKYLRFSFLYHRDWLEAMGREVPKRASRMGIQGLMHVSLACSALHYRDDAILLRIAERVPTLVPHCRSKDACKLLWSFGTLGFQPAESPNLYPSLTEGLRQRKAEFYRYPEHLLTGLLGLAFVSNFPEDLVALALSPEFVDLALKRTQLELKKDLYTLDGAVELELPDWGGPRLSSRLKEEVSDMLWGFATQDVCLKPEVVEAEMCLKDLLGGEEFVRKRMILPHMRSIDFEVHLDSTGKPVPVTPRCSATPSKTSPRSQTLNNWGKMDVGVTLTDELVSQLVNAKSRKAPLKPEPSLIRRVEGDDDENVFSGGIVLTNEIARTLTQSRARPSTKSPVKLAVQVCHRNHYCYRSDQLLGLHAMKRRHLKLAGYTVIELHHWEWFPLLRKSRTEKLAYLHCKIFSQ